mgnify:CR=1 FL=1
MKEQDHWLTIEEAKELAGVTRRTIYNWYDANLLVTVRTPRGALRIRESCLLKEDNGSLRRRINVGLNKKTQFNKSGNIHDRTNN